MGPEKFPHGSKMSAALLLDGLICARCLLWSPHTPSQPRRRTHPTPRLLCAERVYTCLCRVAFGINRGGSQNQIGLRWRTEVAVEQQLKHPPDLIGVGL